MAADWWVELVVVVMVMGALCLCQEETIDVDLPANLSGRSASNK